VTERWKTYKGATTTREYLSCRQRIKEMVTKGVMTLEDIATNPPSDSMRRQARKMWREQYAFDKKRGRFVISYCLGKFEYPGTEEEARLKAKAQALEKLVAWRERRLCFEDLVDYTIIQPVDTKKEATGKSPSLAVKSKRSYFRPSS